MYTSLLFLQQIFKKWSSEKIEWLPKPKNTLFFNWTDSEAVEKQAKEETVVENATPDYAAGLVSTQVGVEFLPEFDTVYNSNILYPSIVIAS